MYVTERDQTAPSTSLASAVRCRFGMRICHLNCGDSADPGISRVYLGAALQVGPAVEETVLTSRWSGSGYGYAVPPVTQLPLMVLSGHSVMVRLKSGRSAVRSCP